MYREIHRNAAFDLWLPLINTAARYLDFSIVTQRTMVVSANHAVTLFQNVAVAGSVLKSPRNYW